MKFAAACQDATEKNADTQSAGSAFFRISIRKLNPEMSDAIQIKPKLGAKMMIAKDMMPSISVMRLPNMFIDRSTSIAANAAFTIVNIIMGAVVIL
ncbi:hypothetical protein [Phaeobacter inhibens]|uniref:hypothetical protein n=1 Tax=Phaeobacter inhibens TaxID=221822 RepID=UPI00248FCE7E|nr:hypothetical protein [Phaeobacter inhibens]